MQIACQISAYAHYARTPVLQLKQRTDDFVFNSLCLLLQASGCCSVVEGISLRACCFDGSVCKVGVGGG